MGTALALLASALWGVADFGAGALVRRNPPRSVVLLAQSSSLIVVLGVASVPATARPVGTYLWWGVASGVAAAVAVGAFYRALVDGQLGVVAPVAATGTLIPVAAGLLAGEEPSGRQLVGILLAVTGLVLLAGPQFHRAAGRTGTAPLLLAGATAVGVGTFVVLFAEGSATSVAMTLVASRATTVLLTGTYVLALAFSKRRTARAGRPAARQVLSIALVGVLEISANYSFGLATRAGLLSVVAVLGSTSPVVAALLARTLLAERLTGRQLAGATTAMAGIVLAVAG